MAVRWTVDEGLQTLINEWKKAHPGATVYTIGDASHQSHTSDHNPEYAGKLPGADAFEVDAADFMPGTGGVTMEDLREFRDDLLDSRDGRLLYMIIDLQIVSSVVDPWNIRRYNGKKHVHLHVSVNDKFDSNTADWKWEDEVAREYAYEEIPGKFAMLRVGDEDVKGKVQYVTRIQGVLNAVFGFNLDCDGVYGANTALAVKHVMRDDDKRTTANGTRIGVPEVKRIFGLW